jgi:kynurenine formamidase
MTSRWGDTDEKGARNLIDAAATLRGIASVKTGEVISLSLPIVGGSRGAAMAQRAPAQHFMTRHGGDYAAGLEEVGGFGYSDDVIMLPTHGATHIDALSHVWCGGRMYNEFAATEVTSKGAARCGIDKLEPIVTRALFADFATGDDAETGRAIGRDELIDAVRRNGVKPEPGDALIVRTGWLKAWNAQRCSTNVSAGLHHDCADWIIESGFALVAADNVAVEVLPSRHLTIAVPLHLRLLRDSGIYLAELLDLERLPSTGRSVFMLVIAPLLIKGGVGSPVTPVAVL